MANVVALNKGFDIASELQRRRSQRERLQTLSDVEELNRRVQAFENGTAKMYTEEEAEEFLKKSGYYD